MTDAPRHRVPAPLAYRIEDASAAIGVSRSTLFEYIKAGRIPSRRIGNSAVIRHCDLEAFLDAAPLEEFGTRETENGHRDHPLTSEGQDKTGKSHHVVPFQAAAREHGISPATLRRLCKQGKGPTLLRPSERRLGIRRGDLDAWIASLEIVPENGAGIRLRERKG